MLTPQAAVHVLEPYGAERGNPGRTSLASPVNATEGQLALRVAAMAADAGTTGEINLSLLWRELSRGNSRVVDGFFSEDGCYLVLERKANGQATPIEGRRLEIVEAVLAGLRQKNIAIDLALAPSTVALNARLALESLGVSGKPSRAHPLLMLAARTAREATLALARFSTFVHDARELRVIGTARPDRALSALLPTAELSVIRSLVEGLSYEEIAQVRGTSTRTVANQVTAVFRRLRVSGRNDLVQRLFIDEVVARQTERPSAETLVPPHVVGPALAKLDGARRSA